MWVSKLYQLKTTGLYNEGNRGKLTNEKVGFIWNYWYTSINDVMDNPVLGLTKEQSFWCWRILCLVFLQLLVTIYLQLILQKCWTKSMLLKTPNYNLVVHIKRVHGANRTRKCCAF